MVTVTIRHYKSLSVTKFVCHHNTYTGDTTFGDIEFLVMNALSTITDELMVTSFTPHQRLFFL